MLLGDELAAREKLDASIEVARGTSSASGCGTRSRRAELEEQGGQPTLPVAIVKRRWPCSKRWARLPVICANVLERSAP